MANAIILHRRRVETVQPGEQGFTTNGVFVAPYSTMYYVHMALSNRAAGSGGRGGDAYGDNDTSLVYGGGGGGGGGGVYYNPYIDFAKKLTKGESYNITVNIDYISLGSIATAATGTAAANGNATSTYVGGAGGARQGEYTISAPDGWTGANLDTAVSGAKGNNGTYGSFSGTGGAGGAGGATGGGKGGQGGSGKIFSGGYQRGSAGSSGSVAATTGSITISWGGNT